MTHPQDTAPANPAQGVREALSDCLDMLARFTHSTSNDLNHVEARAVYRAGRAALAAIGAAPKPPGWPDPLQSPQAEALRNGKLDDTEIRNLFDSMERELRLHRERAVNPAQGVSVQAVEAAQKVLERRIYDEGGVIGEEVTNMVREMLATAIGAGRSSEPEFETAPDNGTPAEVLSYVLECARRWVPEARIIGNARAGDIERAIAAICAGGQAVAEPIAYGVFSKHGDLSGFGPTAADAELSVDGGLWDGDYIAPLYTHPAPSGQAAVEVDDIAARLWKADAEDSGTPASVAKGRTREAFDDQSEGLKNRWRKFANAALSTITNPPAQPGWRSMDSAPNDGTKIQVWADGYEWPEIIYYERYDDATAAEAGSDGYWRYADNLFADVAEVEADTLNYWQPLPAAPQPKGE